MNISNAISYDSTYSKKDSSELQIKQSVPEVKEKNNYSDSLSKVDKTEKIDEINDFIDKSNKDLQVFDRKLEISIHEKTREVMVKVIDTNTDEIIREIPPEKVLDNVANLKERLGFLIDKRI